MTRPVMLERQRGRMVRQLVGRDAQVGAVRAWLGDRSALPASLLIEGSPGIGKSSLVQAAIDIATTDGYRVLASTPAEAEVSLAYAGLGDLTAGATDTMLAGLPAPQREAMEIALLLRPPGADPPDARAVAVAFLGGLRLLAVHAPVLMALDDWQWLDAASAAVVQFALRRLATAPVAVLIARRTTGDPDTTSWPADLPSPRRLVLEPLSLGALHALVYERLDLVLSRPLLRRLHERSGGNPMWALELARAVRDGRLTLAPEEPLPVGLAGLIGERIRTFPHPTRTALAAMAAMARPSLERLRQTVDGIDPESALAPAITGEVVTVDAGRLAFTHPLLASVALGRLDPSERRALHGRLARSSSDPEERVRHVALAAEGPDAAAAAELETVAGTIRRRAGAVEAAELLALARRLTPPADADARARRASTEADLRLEAGDPAAAADLLDALLLEAPPGPARARILARLARVQHFRADVAGGVALLRAALAEPDLDDGLRGGIEEGLAWGLLLMRADLAGAWAHARSSAEAAVASGDEAAQAEALAAVALTELVHGQPASGAMEAALTLEAAGAVAHLRVLRHPSFAAAYVGTCTDDLLVTRDRYRMLLARADARGDESGAATIRAHLSIVQGLLGDLDVAVPEAEHAAELAFQAGLGPTQASALGRLALLHAWRGDLDAAQVAAARSLALAGGEGFAPEAPAEALARGGEHALWASGELALARDDAAGAVRVLEPLATLLIEAGLREPGELRFLPLLVDALGRVGRLDRAAEHVAFLEAQALRVGRPGTWAAALRARGSVEAAAPGGLERAVATLGAAVEHARSAPVPLELGRALLALGRVQRRLSQKRDARASLAEAAEVFERIGARGDAAAARAELGRIGGRAPSRDRLTPTEMRVAGLVAQGRSNKQIAAELVVTPKAVEAVIARLFAKLEVHSRTELAARVLSDGAGPREGKA